MSRVLIKTFFFFIAIIGLSILLYALLTGRYPLIFLSGLFFILFVLMIVNNKILQKCKRTRSVFSPKSRVRNVDCLIIGDMIDAAAVISSGENYVQIKCPNRGYISCVELLKHTHSILCDNGKVIVAIKKKMLSRQKGFNIFDVTYFHRVTISNYRLYSLKYKSLLPIFFSPARTIGILLNRCKKAQKCDNEELIQSANDLAKFCNERGYRFELWLI